MLLEEAQQEWLIAVESEGKRPATVETYRTHTGLVIKALKTQGVASLDDISPFHIRRWMVDYQKNHAPVSLLSYFRSLRAFLRWCQREELLKSAPLKNVKTPKEPETNKDIYSAGQIRAILAAVQESRTPLGIREAALIAVLADTGLRATEICYLTLSDLNGDSLNVRRTKSGQPRPAYLGNKSMLLLSRYLTRSRPKLRPKGDWLFVSDKGEQLTRNAIRCVLRRLEEKLGFPVGAHKFRHTWATLVARAGVNTSMLQALAGWSDIRMAQKYVHLAAKDLRAAHERARPLDGL